MCCFRKTINRPRHTTLLLISVESFFKKKRKKEKRVRSHCSCKSALSVGLISVEMLVETLNISSVFPHNTTSENILMKNGLPGYHVERALGNNMALLSGSKQTDEKINQVLGNKCVFIWENWSTRLRFSLFMKQ